MIIPSNDDAIRAVRLITSKMADAVIEGKQGQDEQKAAKEDDAADDADQTVSEDSLKDLKKHAEGKD